MQLMFKHRDSGGDKSGEEEERLRQKRKQNRESWRAGESDSSYCGEDMSPLLLSFLQHRLSAPGSHTRGASHPIITLKWQ